MSPVTSLDPAQQATLQLLLQRGKAYGEIAGTLGLSEAAVRSRAHAALTALGPEAAGVDAERRGQVADYLLRQQDDEERAATRRYLAGSAGGRAWARAVSSELAGLARDPLPEIPEAGPGEAPGAAAAGTAEPAHADRGAAEAAGDDEGGVGARRGAPPSEPLRDDGRRGRSSRLGGALLLAGLGILVAVVVILLVSGGSGDDEATTPTRARTAAAPQRTTAQGQPQPIAQVNLRATAAGGKAVGVAQILRQGNQLALAIVAQRLAPNTRRNAYAVWLYRSPTRARLLGFVDPPVGKDRRFSNFQALPRDANRYRDVIVTRETQQTDRPGTIVLRGPLRLQGGS